MTTAAAQDAWNEYRTAFNAFTGPVLGEAEQRMDAAPGASSRSSTYALLPARSHALTTALSAAVVSHDPGVRQQATLQLLAAAAHDLYAAASFAENATPATDMIARDASWAPLSSTPQKATHQEAERALRALDGQFAPIAKCVAPPPMMGAAPNSSASPHDQLEKQYREREAHTGSFFGKGWSQHPYRTRGVARLCTPFAKLSAPELSSGKGE